MPALLIAATYPTGYPPRDLPDPVLSALAVLVAVLLLTGPRLIGWIMAAQQEAPQEPDA